MKALDLFAGTGWGVACKWLGIEEDGVEMMAEAVATREANGMKTIYRDVWEGLRLGVKEFNALYGKYSILIASPPCQTFSAAGNGAGRKALDEVLEAIALHAYKNPELLKEFGEKHDDRTALVLTPLAYIYRDMPEYVVLEQVPTVQPVWEAYAEVMREWGYTVDTAILNAEQYGVPQTRRRSILIARLGGPISLPKPTHSRYYSRTPEKLDEGVLKWVSMREALGWAEDEATFVQNNRMAHQAVRTLDQPAPTVTAGHDSGNRGFNTADGFEIATPEQVAALQSYPVAVKSMGAGMVERHGDRPGRTADQPAFTIRASAGGTEPGGFRLEHDGETRKITPEEAATLQSYPTGLRSNYGTSGDKDNRGERSIDEPAATVTSKANRNLWQGDQAVSGPRATPEQAAALQSYPTALRPELEAWKWIDAPATTVAGDPRITAREHHYHGEQNSTSLRITTDEASTLQTFEHPFVWKGSKTKQYLQIGNAVPPLLALAVLRTITHPEPAKASRRRRTLV